MSYCIIRTTCFNKKEAKIIAKKLLDEKLAACIQISKIESFYSWDKELREDEEFLLRIKTKESLYDKIESVIVKYNSYEVPQILSIPINKGSYSYLNWIDQNLGN